VSIHGSSPVCILAEKVEGEVDEPIPASTSQTVFVRRAGGYCHCGHCHEVLPAFDRFLTREEEAQYRSEVENCYSRKVVNELMGVMGVGEGLAVRAVRACCNDLSDAIDFIELEQVGGNYHETDIENKPIKEPSYEQSFLTAYIEQQKLASRLTRSRDDYLLFVASMREKSPMVYEVVPFLPRCSSATDSSWRDTFSKSNT
jgi:hypothetical protein